MSKIILLILFIPMTVWSEELRSVQVKSGDCSTMAAGWVCYDEPSLKRIDETMKEGMRCKSTLTQCEGTLLRISQFVPAPKVAPMWFHKKWVQTLGVCVLSVGLGVGIGVSL